MYKGRIKKPVDIIKQPILDITRLISFLLYRLLKETINGRNYPCDIKKILLIRRNRLGDAVNILPVIEGIKQCHPDIEIHVLANKYNAVIFNHSQFVDKIYVIDEKWLLGKITFFIHPLLLSLRNESYDIVIGLGGFSSVLAQMALWIKGKYNVGTHSKKGSIYDLIYDQTVPELPRGNRHHVDDMAHIVRRAKLNLPDPLPYTHMSCNKIKQNKYLAICPDVKRIESRYSVSNYAEVLTELLNSGEISRAILFTESENSLYRALEKYGAHWCPTKNVEEFIQKIAECEWAITSEGGSAHISGALGLGVIVLSGMGHQTYWRPYARFVRILEEKNAINNIDPNTLIFEFRSLKFKIQACD